jgi:hypothetical protein
MLAGPPPRSVRVCSADRLLYASGRPRNHSAASPQRAKSEHRRGGRTRRRAPSPERPLRPSRCAPFPPPPAPLPDWPPPDPYTPPLATSRLLYARAGHSMLAGHPDLHPSCPGHVRWHLGTRAWSDPDSGPICAVLYLGADGRPPHVCDPGHRRRASRRRVPSYPRTLVRPSLCLLSPGLATGRLGTLVRRCRTRSRRVLLWCVVPTLSSAPRTPRTTSHTTTATPNIHIHMDIGVGSCMLALRPHTYIHGPTDNRALSWESGRVVYARVYSLRRL